MKAETGGEFWGIFTFVNRKKRDVVIGNRSTKP